MRGTILDANSLGDADLSPVTQLLDDWTVHGATRPEETYERIQGIDVVLTNKVVLDAALIEAASALKFIGIMATGTNNVDLDAAKRRGVIVCNAVGYATPSVAQHTFALILNLATRQYRYIDDTARGQWHASDVFCRLDHPIVELSGKTLGIIGLGELGLAVARLGQAFGMTVLALETQRPSKVDDFARVNLSTLLSESDVLSLHCPLTDENIHLINEDTLRQMKRSALLINTARGALVDSKALLTALDQKRISGAAIDVLASEPPTAEEPLLQVRREDLIVTPHNAWGAAESRARLIDQLKDNVLAWASGAPVRRVFPT
ncbi:MAG: D-2-hydroxyacid dehydrogenase [Pseudomonadales bacterium]|jgi:glycerate dehydrogenase